MSHRNRGAGLVKVQEVGTCYIRVNGTTGNVRVEVRRMMMMVASVSLTGPVVLGIFVAGFAIGWIASKVTGAAGIKVQLSGQNLPRGTISGGIKISKSVVRRLTLKCQCGSEWHFTEGSGAQPPDAKPFPTGDTFECPNCGRGIDLKAERKLEAETLAELNLPKTN